MARAPGSRAGAFEELAEELLSRHYDLAYARSSRATGPPIETIALERLDDAALDAAAHGVAERLGLRTDLTHLPSPQGLVPRVTGTGVQKLGQGCGILPR